MITGRQIRAGRAFANISAGVLADLSFLGRVTVAKAEGVDGVPTINKANLNAIKMALESIGVIFQEDGGVNFKPKDQDKDAGKAD